MRADLMEILVCPVCKGELEFTVTKKDAKSGDIIEGGLHCPPCAETYPISGGIPDLLPPDQRA